MIYRSDSTTGSDKKEIHILQTLQGGNKIDERPPFPTN